MFDDPLSETISRLSRLEKLFLTSNKIKGVLPMSICQLESLMLLDVKHNRISKLPKEISKLKVKFWVMVKSQLLIEIVERSKL